MISTKAIIVSLLVSLPITFAADPTCDPTNPLTPASICSIRAAFGGSQIVSTIIPSFLPTGLLEVTYGTVTLGGAQQMSPSRVNTAPVVAVSQVPGTIMGPSYTLVMFDGTTKDLLWLATDLAAQSSTSDLVSNTAPIVPYQSPNPADGSGSHSFVFLLYTQAGPTISIPTPPLTGFDINAFASKYFPGDASAAAGMFFKSQFDGIAFTTAAADGTPATSSASNSASSTTKSLLSSTGLVKVSTSKTSSSESSTTTSPTSGSGGSSGSQTNGSEKKSGYSGLVLVGILSLVSGLIL